MSRAFAMATVLIAFHAAAAGADTVYVSTSDGNLKAISTTTGSISTVGATIPGPSGLAVDGAGNLFVASSSVEQGTKIYELSPAGTIIPNGYGSTIASLQGLAFDPHGNLFAADSTFNNVVAFTTNGAVTVFGSPDVYVPSGIAFDASGNLYVAGNNNLIEKYTPGGVGSVFTTTGVNLPWGLAFNQQGDLFVANAGNNTIEEFTPGGVGTVFASTGLDAPKGLAFDSQGNLYVANSGNGTIEEFTPGGVGSVLATLSSSAGVPEYLAIGLSSVPEPGGLTLMAIAVTALSLRRLWRRRHGRAGSPA